MYILLASGKVIPVALHCGQLLDCFFDSSRQPLQ